ncbi:MAG: hypothetical protein COV75_07260 [Candidatus Omnitrophica bacterium CG11_big_fil_rev_8_21_14_0_20_63_9]|nr:MAG: hypothetical protein COV75_07260 [Candidatus Omnitrophica bacterium CG11_big_fil_rev_8_21_14_0_20_63_9]
MKDIKLQAIEPISLTEAASQDACTVTAVELPGRPPSPGRTLWRVLRAWLIGLFVFGYGPLLTYGSLAWLLNEHQWRWTHLMYFTEVPLIGGFCVLILPWLWYRPIHRALEAWWRGEPVDRSLCVRVYEQALLLPWRVGRAAFAAAFIGYLIGVSVVHWKANQPMSEVMKTLPAIPLVGGMMGAFCYFGTIRALHPLVAWCSRFLRHARPVHRVSLATKFLTTTCVLAVAALCLLQPAAYTLAQVITEQHLTDRTLSQLRVTVYRTALFERQEDRVSLLREAIVGAHGYVFIVDAQGRLLTPHPRGYTHVSQEGIYQLEARVQGTEGAWVDRVGRHRVVAFSRLGEDGDVVLSMAFPSDFAGPLERFVQFSLLVVIQILFVVALFGRYFTRGITTPLSELTQAARRIAERGDLSQHVPVTTTDELSEVARAFNHMVDEMRASKAAVDRYTRQLERSTQELSALNQEMEDLLRVVSHDLRAPLINIQGFSRRLEPIMQEAVGALESAAADRPSEVASAQLASVKQSVHTRFAESLRFIAKSIEKMDALLSSLLAISRVGRKADPMQMNDLNQIVDDVLATFEHQMKERAIHVIRHPLPSRVPCRRNEINQVISNLVSNAITYMGATGNRFIEIGGKADAEHAECYVRDSGIGIGAEDHERIFQIFTRLQAIDVEGEGIGLAYVKKILRSHGGKITVTSTKGQGSTFAFTLPMTTELTRG